MLTPSNEVQEHSVKFPDFGHTRNDLNRKTHFEINRQSPFSISTSSSSFPQYLPAKRSSWRSLSFGKFSAKPIRLSILKLDGSSFEIVVFKRATVAKVKKAIEAAFSYLPTQGDDEFSWSYVWGNFCLCFENMKLIRDRDSISRFGIKNGDQLQFVRHTPVYEVTGERFENITIDSNPPKGSSSKSDLNTDIKKDRWNIRSNHNRVRNEVNRSSWACMVRRLFLHRKTGGTVTLGQWFPSIDDDDGDDDDDTDDDGNISCKLSVDSSCYLPNPFSEFAGGFGYPTGYCIK
ncbi:hypothetical protein LXL04_005321 [Taraxacum kok-saghyz]